MKLVFSFLFLFSIFANAESIVCENQSQNIYEKVKLEITEPEDEFGFVEGSSPILNAELNFPLIKQQIPYKVFRTLRQNKILYFDISGKVIFPRKNGHEIHAAFASFSYSFGAMYSRAE